MFLDHVMQVVRHGQDVALLALEQLKLVKEGRAYVSNHAAKTFLFAHGIRRKTPAESTRRGRRCPQETGGGSAAGWCSFQQAECFGATDVYIYRVLAFAQRFSDLWPALAGVEHFSGSTDQFQNLLRCSLVPYSEPPGAQRVFLERDQFTVCFRERAVLVFTGQHNPVFAATDFMKPGAYKFGILRKGELPFTQLPPRVPYVVFPHLDDRLLANAVAQAVNTSDLLECGKVATVNSKAMVVSLLALLRCTPYRLAESPVAVLGCNTSLLQKLTNSFTSNPMLKSKVFK